MPIKLRCYCGYVLTLRSALAGKKIRCSECDEVLTVPVPGQKKAQNKRRPPQRDPWDEGFAPQPSYEQPSYEQPLYEQPEYFLPGSVGSPSTPHRRKRSSRQSNQQITKYVGIVFVVAFLGCAGILGFFAMKNRVKFDTPENERARVLKEAGQGRVVGRTYSNDYFKLILTIPEPYYILDEQQKKIMESVGIQLSGTRSQFNSSEKSMAAREQILLMAMNNMGDELDDPNAGIFVLVTRIGNVSEIQTPRGYLETVQKNAARRRTEISTQPVEDGYSLGQLRAVAMKMTQRASGKITHVTIYTSRVRDYQLSLIIIYENENDRKALERIVRSVQASE